MERDAELGVLGATDNDGGENGPRTFALAGGRSDTDYYSVVVVLWSLTSRKPVSGLRTSDLDQD